MRPALCSAIWSAITSASSPLTCSSDNARQQAARRAMSVAGGMGTNFDALPPRIRYRPLSKAIWAALMLDVGMLRVFVAILDQI